MRILRTALFCILIGTAGAADAAGGPLGIDHRLRYDNSGPWSSSAQTAVEVAVPALILGAALWQGDDDRLGHTSWQAVDALALGAVTSTALKYSFSRSRPSQTDDPDRFFQGRGNASFPSFQVMWVTSAVTPYVLEYAGDHPWVLGLEAIPLYVATARLKNRAHWQTDVLASLVIGTAIGYYTHSRKSSLSVSILPRGVSVGWKKNF